MKLLNLLAILTFCLFNFAKAETQNYVGKLGKADVVFHLEFNNSDITGYYFYQNVGININLTGKIENNVLTIYELDYNKNKTAVITAKFDDKNLRGIWKDKTSKEASLELKTTNLKVPELPKNLWGSYQNTEDPKCKFILSIYQQVGRFFYRLQTSEKDLTGKLTFYRSLEEGRVYLTLTGIEWAEYEGALDEDGEPKVKNLKLPIGIEGLLSENEIVFQNYGNSMNYYVKFSDCGAKFIHLTKQK
ncbi:hypothetical protein [Solitalea lacus]|uniref:hypothetical protein n=1 Tax=Solitalea lacus TaxID=2911172 RepID=UPI001EDB9DD5|nr:hypothetical protein [Solitalea lacus]UKJ08328.1 hypothetical protein L2B55_03950 [Solitalea lacus]